MDVSKFIDSVATGNAVEAKDVLNDLLSARAFESLDARKTELAQSLFTGSQVEEEQLNLEDYSLEELQEFMVSEEFEQLDELSKSTLGSYVNKASKDAVKSSSASTNWARTSDRARNPRVKVAAAQYSDEEEAREKKRLAGIGKAVKKLTK
jgi:hypothetical protein